MNFSLKALIVDDVPSVRRQMRNILRTIGFDKVVEAANGDEAIGCLNANDIGFIVSDWNMPNMNGLEFLKNVRSIEKYNDIPFLMVTADSTKENVLDAVEAGVSNYIVKPVLQDVLESKLKLILRDS